MLLCDGRRVHDEPWLKSADEMHRVSLFEELVAESAGARWRLQYEVTRIRRFYVLFRYGTPLIASSWVGGGDCKLLKD